ncbi:MAG: glycine--tRNA ligase subunit beta [Rhodothalassiaceae bacterium]
MPELLLELFSEEIPARMQDRAGDDLKRLMAAALEEARLAFEHMEAHATPRRLALLVRGLPERQPDIREERRGPRVDAPEKALAGFRRSLPESATIEKRETPKGRFLYAVVAREGRKTTAVMADIVPDLVQRFSWPKSMRWGAGDLRWVRPLRAILCLFDGKPVEFEVDGLRSGTATRGHRFLAPEPFTVTGFDDYRQKLKKAKVILDAEARRERIAAKAAKLAREAGLALVPDEAMIAENAGLTEWPYPLLGHFDPAFLDVPEEVLVSAMRHHQKYLTLRDPATGRLAPAFICVANIEAPDGGKAIIAGNERVLGARLADARFFWEQDLKVPLEERLPALEGVVFHEKLGSMAERVARTEALAVHIAERYVRPREADRSRFDELSTNGSPGMAVRPSTGSERTEFNAKWHADRPEEPRRGVSKGKESAAAETTYLACIQRAARLAKADLVTGTVGEFPELQGVIGARLAAAQGEPEAVARAIEEHYAPKGPDDRCPSEPVPVAVALAEKLDTLVGFFAIGETPTGSKDPFALRRAALGVIRLIVENGLRIPLKALFAYQLSAYFAMLFPSQGKQREATRPLHPSRRPAGGLLRANGEEERADGLTVRPEHVEGRTVTEDLLAFFAERLKVQQRAKGVRHDLIDAVFSLGGEDDLVRLLKRVHALADFIATEDGAHLLAGYKRAANIVRIEEKRDKVRYGEVAVDPGALVAPEEERLHAALNEARKAAGAALGREDFAAAMHALAALRAPIDAFFDKVTVNAEDASLRRNRLALLAEIRAAMNTVADFSKIEG